MGEKTSKKLVDRITEEVIYFNKGKDSFSIKGEYVMLNNLYKYYMGVYKYEDAGLVFISNFFIELDAYIIRNPGKYSYEYFINEFKNRNSKLYSYFKTRLKTVMALGINTSSDKVIIDKKPYYVKASGVSLDKLNKNNMNLYDVVEDTKHYNTRYMVSEKELVDFMWTLTSKDLELIHDKDKKLSAYNKVRIQVKLMDYLIREGQIEDDNYYIRLVCVLKSKVVGRGKNINQIKNILMKEGIPYQAYNNYISETVPYGEQMSKYIVRDYKDIMREYLGVKMLKKPVIIDGGDKSSKVLEITPEGLFKRISSDGVSTEELKLNEEGEVIKYYIDIKDAKYKGGNK